jgi:hypothetical protein
MNITIDSGVSAIIGAFIGSMVSVIIMLIQRKVEYKRKLIEVVYEMAKETMSQNIEIAKMRNNVRNETVSLYPIECWYHYHYKVLEVMNKKGSIIKNEIEKIRSEQINLNDNYLNWI